MRPGLGPVFPRVRAGVAAHVAVGPVGRRALVVVHLQRGRVVGAVVAEQRAKVVDPRRGQHQQVPVVVADLVAEVAQQRAVGLAHLGADALAHRVFGLLGVQGDHAVVVARHHVRGAGHVAEEIESQAVDRVGVAAHHRQAQRQQLRDEPALGLFELAPENAVGLLRQVGNGARHAAGQAEAGRQAVHVDGQRFTVARGGHHPAAGRGGHEVGAAAVHGALRIAEHGEGVGRRARALRRCQRHDAEAVGHIAERRAARQALAVAQEHGAPALAAVRTADGGCGKFGGERGRAFGLWRHVLCRGCLFVHGEVHGVYRS